MITIATLTRTFAKRVCRFSIQLVGIIALAFGGVTAHAETYIVPIWAQALAGSDGTWWATATVVNPNTFPVSVRIVDVFPFVTEACDACPVTAAPITVPARGTAVLRPLSGQQRQRLIAGALELESSAPVHIHLVAVRSGATEIRQRLDVARAWLSPGAHLISSVERGGAGWRMNVFVVNPSDANLAVSVWAGDRAENEVRAVVAPRSMGVIGLPPPTCGGVPCPVGDTYPPPLLQVHVEAAGVFLANVSSITSTWAVFSPADESVGLY